MYKVLYLNYTAIDPHIGCIGVCYVHLTALFNRGIDVETLSNYQLKGYWQGDRTTSLEYISNSELSSKIYDSDAIVINGEGTLHHNRGLFLLSIAEFAITVGVPVFLINTTIQEIDGFDAVLSSLSDLAVREKSSYEYLISKGINCRLTVDSIVNADFSTIGDRDYSSKLIINDWHPHAELIIQPIVDELIVKSNTIYHPLHDSNAYSNWRYTVANYQTAELIIAPRYHSIYLSGLGGSPFIALPSNSHKVSGVIYASGLPIPICSNIKDLNSHMEYAKNNPNLYLEFRDYLSENKNKDFIVFDRYFNIAKPQFKESIQEKINAWENKIDSHYNLSMTNFYNNLLVKDLNISAG
jgi:hypothetical protein